MTTLIGSLVVEEFCSVRARDWSVPPRRFPFVPPRPPGGRGPPGDGEPPGPPRPPPGDGK
ncbi:hypothetical protein F7P10_10295 [Actinomadura sp. WMMB 499]|nr:hypothetical protein F7P10_10295 [Actinomadura sp. WMMB 499]